jgi:hypothetical protein
MIKDKFKKKPFGMTFIYVSPHTVATREAVGVHMAVEANSAAS